MRTSMHSYSTSGLLNSLKNIHLCWREMENKHLKRKLKIETSCYSAWKIKIITKKHASVNIFNSINLINSIIDFW